MKKLLLLILISTNLYANSEVREAAKKAGKFCNGGK